MDTTGLRQKMNLPQDGKKIQPEFSINKKKNMASPIFKKSENPDFTHSNVFFCQELGRRSKLLLKLNVTE